MCNYVLPCANLLSLLLQGVILYIMLTGFPPYDLPTRQDERFDIICSGELMNQLQAWESKFISLSQCFVISTIHLSCDSDNLNYF